ncbi:MAG: GNAT family N-acetyltransferase [Anaerolineaceae bacterium]|nr:GNAT family N-acetyltransferase [Anaerolineaceae bacterium]
MNFRDALISVYCENPCQVLPNALWKTLAQLENLQTSICTEKDGVMNMQAWNETNLMVYWTHHRNQSFEFSQSQTSLNLALIHQDYLQSFPSKKFNIQEPYFRLIHRQNESQVKAIIPSRFSFVEVNLQHEAEKVSDLIGQCYQDLQPTVESVMNWGNHPTFDPSLWVWVIDNSKGIPIGLGIAEIDKNVLEGSLEWIQVLPNYRGMGIGKCIVQELLSRLEKQVNFTTVAGEMNNTTNPEALYRSCGFMGSDIWWMFSI